ncbi:MAG TPA: 30S ribosomal protein S2 [Solirubrobacterales bacterium]|nr:30S ribosomal protein S2 [Solirubrobacterales bacterium]
MPEAELKELLEAGVHFGHQTRRWNPNMRRFIFGEMDGIHIIDLLQTEALLENARKFAGELATGGGTVLFVGTKKQARDTVQEWADKCQMPYVNKRWLGGLLTNFNTMSGRIARLHELNGWKEEGKLDLLPTKERMGMEAELAKLEFNLGGVRDMDRLPDAVFVADLKTEEIAVNEAARLRIPIIGLVDTNCDPTPVDYVIPGNDDAIRSCELVIGTIGKAVEDGSSSWRVQEEKRIAEEMERRKREEEERKKREEEEKARKEAEEAKQHEEETARKQAEKKAAEAQAAQKQQAPAAEKPAQDKGSGAAGPVSDTSPSPTGDGPASSPPAAQAAKEAAPAAEEKAAPTVAGEASVAEVKEEASAEQPPAPPAESAEPVAEEKAAETEGESK